MSKRKFEETTNKAKVLTSSVIKPEVKKPTLYKVVLLNDDYTPMAFVTEVLETFFSMGKSNATRTMLQVHKEGKAVCGLFTKDIAETKVTLVNECSRLNQYPLLCCMEKV